MRKIIYALVLTTISASASAQDNFPVSSTELSAWSHFLASDQMKGRENGSVEMAVAAGYIAAQFESAGLKPAPGLDSYISEFSFETRRGEKIFERNVIGYLEGSDPVLKNEFIIFSSHFDHVGTGRPVDGDSIYNGANDNAAGTATIMGLAHSWARSGARPERSVIFVAFAGEEMGMRGSTAFVGDSIVPPGKIFLNLNMEMTGHCTNLGKQRYYITGQSFTNFDELLDKYNETQGWKRVDTVTDADRLFFASDNRAFALTREGNGSKLNTPAFTLCTHGGEDHIHRPHDEPQYMDCENMASLVNYLHNLGLFLAGIDRSLIQWDNEEFDKFTKSLPQRR